MKKISWELPVFLMLITAIVMVLIYLFTGHAPVVSRLTYECLETSSNGTDILNTWEYILPTTISRFWDIPIIGIVGFLWGLATKHLREKWNEIDGMFVFQSGIYGLFVVVFVVIFIHMHVSAFSTFALVNAYGLIGALIFSLVGKYKKDYGNNLFYSALTGLVSWAFLGLQTGLVIGFLLGLAIFMAYALVSLLGRSLKSLFMLFGWAEYEGEAYLY